MKRETIKYEDLTEEVNKAVVKALEIEFWGQPWDEVYYHTDLDDAIEAVLDDVDDLHNVETLVFVGARSMTLTVKDIAKSGFSIGELLENLDENYGSPDEDSVPTQAMRDAWEAFAQVIVDEYKPWACETVLKVELTDPLGWVKEHRPDWLEET